MAVLGDLRRSPTTCMRSFNESLVLTVLRILIAIAMTASSVQAQGVVTPRMIDPEISNTILRDNDKAFDYEYREEILKGFERSLSRDTTHDDFHVKSVTLLAWKISRSNDGVPPTPEESILLVASDTSRKRFCIAKISRKYVLRPGWNIDGRDSYGGDCRVLDAFPDSATIRRFASQSGFWPNRIEGYRTIECLILDKRAKELTSVQVRAHKKSGEPSDAPKDRASRIDNRKPTPGPR